MRKRPLETAGEFGRRMGWQPGVVLAAFPLEGPRYVAAELEITGYRETEVSARFWGEMGGPVPVITQLSLYDYLPANTYWGA